MTERVVAEPLVRIEGLRHGFAGRPALRGISAKIVPGIITGLIGPDAAGKTTLLRLIAGLLRPGAGRITVLGHDMATDAAAAHASIGYMPQRFGLYEDLTVAENLDLFADLHGISVAERAERSARLLHFTGLARFNTRLAGKLSGGMKQKLGLACALLARPRLSAAGRTLGGCRSGVAPRAMEHCDDNIGRGTRRRHGRDLGHRLSR